MYILCLMVIMLFTCSRKNTGDINEDDNPTQTAKGSCIWLSTAGGKFAEYGQKLAIDSHGNIYLTGYFNGTATFGDFTLTADGNNNSYAAKLDPEGNFIWVKSFGGTALFTNDYFNSITIDDEDNIYLTGIFDLKAQFGQTILNSHNGSTDIFIAKLDKSGNFLWAKNAGGNQNADHSIAICAGSNGDIYLTGTFYYKAWFDDIELSAENQGYYTFLAAMDKAGNFLWAKREGTSSLLAITDIASGTNGDILIVGYYFSDENLGGVALGNSSNVAATFVAEINQYGVTGWVSKALSSNGGIFGRSICRNNQGDIFITGSFVKDGTVGSTILSSSGKDAFWSKLNKNGDWIWTKQSRTEALIDGNYCSGCRITTDADDNIYLAGNFSGNYIFQDNTYQTNNNENGFWAGINNNGSMKWFKKNTPTGTAGVYDLIPDNIGHIYTTGYYGNKAAFDSIQPIWRGSTDVYILKSKN
jgi:hypothetical protein